MCRKTFWYYGIDRFSFSRHNQYLIAETLSMKCFASDQNRLDIVKSIFSFFNLLIVSLPPGQIFPTSGGKSRTPRQIAKSYQGETYYKIPVVLLIISKARNLVQITANPPEIRFYSEDRITLRAEATFSLCELSCEK